MLEPEPVAFHGHFSHITTKEKAPCVIDVLALVLAKACLCFICLSP